MVTITSVFLASYVAVSSASSNKPGSCKRENGKNVCPENTGSCVSVKNDFAGISNAAQCTIEPVCSGNQPGACPTFSAWPRTFLRLQPMCAFIEPDNCKATSTVDNVDCFEQSLTFEDETIVTSGIYGCVDATLYASDNLGYFQNFTTTQLAVCEGEDDDSNLCNGQGTCSPVAAMSSTYACICNKGFTEADNCLAPTSNECNSAGQCGAGGKCNVIVQECECLDGIGGTQCNECTTDVSCGGETGTVGETAGTCDTASKTCKCNSGFTGPFCYSITASGAASITIPLTLLSFIAFFALF